MVLSCLLPLAAGQGVLPVPQLTGRVVDQTGTLNDGQRASLEQKLASLEQQSGAQLVVLLVPTTAPEDISAYANRVGNDWKIGRKGIGDGLLLLVAKNDRKLRIEVAKSLEGAVPDLMANRVIADVITPKFKQGDFAGGIEAGVDALSKLVKAEGLPGPGADETAAAADLATAIEGFWVWYLILFGIFAKLGGGIFAVFYGVFCALLGWLFAGLVWTITANADWTLWASFCGIPFGIVTLLIFGLNSTTATRVGKSHSSSGSSSWGSGSFGSDSSSSSSDSSSGFSSGGGGDFGGGGSSGSW